MYTLLVFYETVLVIQVVFLPLVVFISFLIISKFYPSNDRNHLGNYWKTTEKISFYHFSMRLGRFFSFHIIID